MRFVILRKADPDTEAGVMPVEGLVEAMGRYNEMLVDQGVMLSGAGLRPSADGARVTFTGGEPVVVDGPFTETKELLAGFTMIEADSLAAAVEWAKQWPAVDGGGEFTLEVRPLYEIDDVATGDGAALHHDLARRIARQPALMNAYVVFGGNCREAFEEYADCLGGKIEMVMTHGESPMAKDMPHDMHDKVLHAQIQVGNWVLMGSDMAADCYTAPQGFSVQLSISDSVQAESTFARLARGGTIQMPFGPTFWAHRFGMLVDRFGIPWMINCDNQI